MPRFVPVRRHELRALTAYLLTIDDELDGIVDREVLAAVAEGTFDKKVEAEFAAMPEPSGTDEVEEEVDAEPLEPYASMTYDEIREMQVEYNRDQFRSELLTSLRSQFYLSVSLLTAATLESSLIELARHLDDTMRPPLRFNQVSGPSWPARVQSYFRQLSPWPFPSDKEWARVTDLADVRNLLAHGRGRAGPVSAQELAQWRARLSGLAKRWGGLRIELSEGGSLEHAALLRYLDLSPDPDTVHLMPDRAFCREAIQLTETVLGTLYSPWSDTQQARGTA